MKHRYEASLEPKIHTNMTFQQKLKDSTITGNLDVSDMDLTTLPSLPSTLTHLVCANNQLTTLPPLPSSITHLICTNNQLTSLPILPSTLIYLGCDLNQLTSLPPLPPTLIHLFCASNQLKKLPMLPSTITLLYCGHNQLTTLPALPKSLKLLYCNYNQLTILPKFPLQLRYLSCTDNPYVAPFRDFISHCEESTIQNIEEYYHKLQTDARNTLAFAKTLARGYNSCLNDDCLNTIGSYLSGQTSTLSLQIAELRTMLL